LGLDEAKPACVQVFCLKKVERASFENLEVNCLYIDRKHDVEEDSQHHDLKCVYHSPQIL